MKRNKFRTRAVQTFGFCLAALAAAACNEEPKNNGCDGQYIESSVASYCAYGVLTGGFRECPASFPVRIDIPAQGTFGASVVCVNKTGQTTSTLPANVCASINRSSANGCGGATISDAGTDAQTDGAIADNAVAQCQATVDSLIAVCQAASEGDRVCAWQNYRALCATEDAEAINAAATCFVGDTTCRAFGDPGTTANIACVNQALTSRSTAQESSSRAAICESSRCGSESSCTNADYRPHSFPVEFLSNGTGSALATCIASANSCANTGTCFQAVFPDTNNCRRLSCEQTVQAYENQCRTEDPTHGRLCLYPLYKQLCATERSSVVQQTFQALSGSGCQTPSDPSSAQRSLSPVVSSNTSAVAGRISTRYCQLCSTGVDCAQQQSAELMLHTDLALAGVDTCVQAATTCSAANACNSQLAWFANAAQQCPSEF